MEEKNKVAAFMGYKGILSIKKVKQVNRLFLQKKVNY